MIFVSMLGQYRGPVAWICPLYMGARSRLARSSSWIFSFVHVIQQGTVEDVRRAVESACRVGGKDGCFILGTSDSIRENTPMENIDAYFKYGQEYGMR